MSDQDLFKDTKDTNQAPVTPVTDSTQKPSTDYSQMLGMIVNAEGKPKYTNIEDALKGAAHAQAHIANLEQEMSTLRASGESSKKIEDILASLQSQKNVDQTPSDNGQPKGLSETDIQNLVKNAVMDIQSHATQETNIKTVTGKFKELYGEKASETLYSKANDLGMSKEDINGLIAKNPAAAFRVLGIENKSTPKVNLQQNSVNTNNFQGQPPATPVSSMGYVTSKQLESNWLDSKKRTLERLNRQG